MESSRESADGGRVEEQDGRPASITASSSTGAGTGKVGDWETASRVYGARQMELGVYRADDVVRTERGCLCMLWMNLKRTITRLDSASLKAIPRRCRGLEPDRSSSLSVEVEHRTSLHRARPNATMRSLNFSSRAHDGLLLLPELLTTIQRAEPDSSGLDATQLQSSRPSTPRPSVSYPTTTR